MSKLNWDKRSAIVKLTVHLVCLFCLVNCQILLSLPWIFPDPEPHDEENCCDNQAELYDEGVEVGGGLGHDVPHQVDPPARKIVKLDRPVHPELGVLIGLLQQVVAIQALAVGVGVIACKVYRIQSEYQNIFIACSNIY